MTTPSPAAPGSRPARQRAARRPLDHALLVVAVCAVAANMRPAITAVGPLLEQIGTDTGISLATLGLLTAIPLAAWAVVSPFARGLSVRFGTTPVLLWSLVLMLAATLVRSLIGVGGLWIGTALVGVGIAILNVLMPAIVKRDFPGHVALMTGLYTALLGGFGAIASGLAVPLSRLGDEATGWRISLAITGAALLPIAIAAWAVAGRRREPELTRPALRGAARLGIWRDPLAWLVALYMGFQASTFYMLVTWTATISLSLGRSEIVAGADVMVYQFASLVGSLALPLILRPRAERYVPFLIPVIGVAGTAGLMLWPDALTAWITVLGIFSGASLSMAMTLMAHRARDHDASAALSGMAQSVGYVIAAFGPVAFGWLHAWLGGWTWSLSLLLVVMAVQVVIGVFVGRPRFVLDRAANEKNNR